MGHRTDLAGSDGGAEAALDGVNNTLGAAVIGEPQRHSGVLGGVAGVRDAYALVGEKVEELVFLDGSAHGRAELIACEERYLSRDGRRSVVEERRGVHGAVLEILVCSAVNLIRAGLGDHADMRAAVSALRGIVHGRVHADFLDSLHRRRGQRLANGAVNGSAGLDLTARAKVFAGVEHETVLTNLAGGIAVKQIVGVDAVQREAIAGVTLAIGEDGLIPEPRIAAGAAQEIGVDAGTQDGQLRETTGAQRRLLNGQLIDHVPVGSVHLVHQRRRGHFDGGGDGAHLQVAIHRGGAVGVDQDLGVRFGLEPFLGERHPVSAGRNVGRRIRPVGLGVLDNFQIRVDVLYVHGRVGYRGARGVFYGARNAAQNVLRRDRRRKHEDCEEYEKDHLPDVTRT